MLNRLLSSQTAPQRAQVLTTLGQHQFDQGNYIAAAHSYAQSSTPFEQAALAFSDLGEVGRDGLRTFLYARLEKCGKNVSQTSTRSSLTMKYRFEMRSSQEIIQRMLLATWLVEFYLSKINTLDDIIASERASHDVDNLKTEQVILEDDLKSFFETYKASLDRSDWYPVVPLNCLFHCLV